jgi:hypothetical protein
MLNTGGCGCDDRGCLDRHEEASSNLIDKGMEGASSEVVYICRRLKHRARTTGTGVNNVVIRK